MVGPRHLSIDFNWIALMHRFIAQLLFWALNVLFLWFFSLSFRLSPPIKTPYFQHTHTLSLFLLWPLLYHCIELLRINWVTSHEFQYFWLEWELGMIQNYGLFFVNFSNKSWNNSFILFYFILFFLRSVTHPARRLLS